MSIPSRSRRLAGRLVPLPIAPSHAMLVPAVRGAFASVPLPRIRTAE